MRGERITQFYKIGFAIVGGLAFTWSWAYAIQDHGWAAGLILGWIPALVIGMFAGALWPLSLAVMVTIGLAA